MPLFYNPARSSRHRKACLALYKALQRIGATVPLPPDIETGLGPENPLKTLIRNGFRRNKLDTSPRLVSAALKNGYRYLDLLSRAAAGPSSSEEYTSVLSFLRENRDRVLWLKLKTASHKASLPNSAPVPGAVPILTKISDPDDWENPVYVPTKPARDISEIPDGIRKPPRLDAAGTVPFLRLGKPQSRHITRVIRQKNKTRQSRTIAITDMQTEEMDEAHLEDSWDRIVARQMFDEGLWTPTYPGLLEKGVQQRGEHTYAKTLYGGIESLSAVLEIERRDMVARAKAMLEIEQREQALADKEDQERIERGETTVQEVERLRRSMKRSKRGLRAGDFGEATPVREETVTASTEESVVAAEDVEEGNGGRATVDVEDDVVELPEPEWRHAESLEDVPESPRVDDGSKIIPKRSPRTGTRSTAKAKTSSPSRVTLNRINNKDLTGIGAFLKEAKISESLSVNTKKQTKSAVVEKLYSARNQDRQQEPEEKPLTETESNTPLAELLQIKKKVSEQKQKVAAGKRAEGVVQDGREKLEEVKPVTSYAKKARKRFTERMK